MSNLYAVPRILRNDVQTVTPLDARAAAALVIDGLDFKYMPGKEKGGRMGFSLFTARVNGREHWIVTHDSGYWSDRDLLRLQTAASSREGITADITIVTQIRIDTFITLMNRPRLRGNRIADHVIFVTRGNEAYDGSGPYSERYMDKVRNEGFQIAKAPEVVLEKLHNALFGDAPQPRLLLPAMAKQYPMRGYPADLRHRR